MLLRELHHRVKNSLQVVSSMLGMQANLMGDAEAIGALEQSQRRVSTIALLHEQLHQGVDVSEIDLSLYVQNLIHGIRQTFGAYTANIKISIHADKTILGIDAAAHCGLIVNELVSNALEHAFPDNSGEVDVTVTEADGDNVSVVVKDNGVDFPAKVDFWNPESLGLRIVHTLGKQLHASIEFKADRGKMIKLTFPKQTTDRVKISKDSYHV